MQIRSTNSGRQAYVQCCVGARLTGSRKESGSCFNCADIAIRLMLELIVYPTLHATHSDACTDRFSKRHKPVQSSFVLLLENALRCLSIARTCHVDASGVQGGLAPTQVVPKQLGKSSTVVVQEQYDTFSLYPTQELVCADGKKRCYTPWPKLKMVAWRVKYLKSHQVH